MNAKPWGCYNRPAFRKSLIVQDGYYVSVINTNAYSHTRRPKMVLIKNPMSTECNYSATTPDVRCNGCIHNKQTS